MPLCPDLRDAANITLTGDSTVTTILNHRTQKTDLRNCTPQSHLNDSTADTEAIGV